MQVLRTPDSRFAGLADYQFAPHYCEIANGPGPMLRMHYLDEGPREAAPVLLLHGEPSWSYLYRHIIPLLVVRGHRVLAPDLIGFGRSDKPAARTDYTFERHVDWTSAWLTALDLKGITLFCQDWGGLIGLRLVARFPKGSPASSLPTPACRSAAARRRCRSASGSPSASTCRGCRSAG